MNSTKASRRSSHFLFVMTLLVFVTLDLWSKDLAFSRLQYTSGYVVWDGVLKFETTTNPGMMWGMAKSVPAKWWVFIRGSVLIGIIALYFSMPAPSKLVPLAFGLVSAGAIGNIWDNIFQGTHYGLGLFEGAVRDFIRFYWFEFPTFNVADSCICVGAPLLLIVLWRHDRALAAAGAAARRTSDRPL